MFSKGRELYGLFEARQAIHEAGCVLVTEGYMDVVALAQLGFANAVATLGTACTAEHVQKLFRVTDAVVFSFDGDAAGRRAARKALEGALAFASDTRSIRFLFLPPEHDPDSYIRSHGQEAFARCMAEAMPLSRFLLESAREGCDEQSAEGRARMASQARPLWSILPDGALKRQLLAEIADSVQLGSHELAELWGLHQVATPLRGKSAPAGTTPNRAFVAGQSVPHRRTPAPPRPAGRNAPVSRADHAARLLLSRPAWDTLSGEEQAMLCALPAPHGELFCWLEVQTHDHGHQPWGALREGLREHPAEPLAVRLMSGIPLDEPDDPREAERELRALLDRMLVERLKQQETDAIAASSSDPAALERYRRLQARRRALETAQRQA